MTVGESVVVGFQGEHRFLSNFWMCEVEFEGEKYPTVEHAYQASKTTDQGLRKWVKNLSTPGQAKRKGREIPLRSDWSDALKLQIMKDLLWQKFSKPDLKRRLLETGDQKLAEDNTWNDQFWGVYNGHGYNHLGIILMEIRDKLREAYDNRPS